MEAKRFILELASQLFLSMFSRKMWEMMIRMEVMRTLLREEIGGRDHYITKCSGHVMPILNPQRKAIYDYNYYLYRCKWDARALAQPQLANCWGFFFFFLCFLFASGFMLDNLGTVLYMVDLVWEGSSAIVLYNVVANFGCV